LGGDEQQLAHPNVTTKPSACIIAHGVGGTTMRLLGASLVHRRWYGPKQPAAMISGKRDVSGETEVENRGAKVSWHTVHFLLRDHLKNQPPFQDSH
jgi:hypothetical protein